MGNLNSGSHGYVDWNLILNSKGGPNHAGNMCASATVVEGGNLYMHPQYYFIGHFSKYLVPGSKRIKSKVLNSKAQKVKPDRPFQECGDVDGLKATAFKRPDGKKAVVV